MFGESIKKSGGFKAFLVLALFSIWAQEGFSPAQESSFARTLYPVLEKAACRSCHSPDGVASVTRLQFPEPDANADQIEAFGRSLVALIDRNNPEETHKSRSARRRPAD
jgi:mono/diheme cytochrome c family protein